MTQAEPCQGPYRSDGYVKGISCGRVQGPYGTMAHVFGANADQMTATARLLAASWSMRELLRALEDHCEVKTTALGDQESHAEEGHALRQRVRALLTEIDGDVTNP